MTGMLHIYRAMLQPATCYTDSNVDPPMKGGFLPDTMLWCHACDQCWPASQMTIQIYYDHSSLWCADGYVCKDPLRIAKWQERHRLNRSRAMKESWARRKEKANET